MERPEREITKTVLVYFIFGFAMAYLESAVVDYLRKIYYPQGFNFPLKIISPSMAIVELGRELSTLVMLIFVALMHKGNFKERFSLFAFTFAVWDLFYYFWLKVLLNWSSGLGDWDILFLIPAPWIAPWIAPAIISIALIIASLIVLYRPGKFPEKILNKYEWAGEFAAAFLILVSFFTETKNVLNGKIPENFCWWIYIAGLVIGLGIFIRRLALTKSTVDKKDFD